MGSLELKEFEGYLFIILLELGMLGVEACLRDQRVHFLYIWGFKTVWMTFQPRAAPAARKD